MSHYMSLLLLLVSTASFGAGRFALEDGGIAPSGTSLSKYVERALEIGRWPDFFSSTFHRSDISDAEHF